MTLPSYIAAGTKGEGTGDIVPTVGTHTAGDLLILGVQSRTSESVSAPSGWTAIPGGMVSCGAASASCRITLFFKFTAGSEGNPTVTDPGDHAYGKIWTFRGVNASTPFHRCSAFPGRANDATGRAFWPGIVTSLNDCLVLNFLGWGLDNAGPIGSAAGADIVNGTLANVAGRTDEGTTQGLGGGIKLVTGEMATAGVVDPTTDTTSNATPYCAITIALQAADVSAGGGSGMSRSRVVNR